MELWKGIEGYEGSYQVSNTGRIKSLKRNREKILLSNCVRGYLQVKLYINSFSKEKYIHRLVAETFIPNPFNLPEVNHIDNDPSNNNDWNLEWTTKLGNIRHSIKQGRNRKAKGEEHGCAKLTDNEVIMIRKRYENEKISHRELAKQLNISKANITSILNKKTWKHVI